MDDMVSWHVRIENAIVFTCCSLDGCHLTWRHNLSTTESDVIRDDVRSRGLSTPEHPPVSSSPLGGSEAYDELMKFWLPVLLYSGIMGVECDFWVHATCESLNYFFLGLSLKKPSWTKPLGSLCVIISMFVTSKIRESLILGRLLLKLPKGHR